MSAVFRVPIAYQVEAVPPGKRKGVEETVFEWAEVDVATEDDAPVATEWRDADGRVRRTLWHGESHWLQYDARDEDGVGHALSAEGMADALARGRSFSNPLAHGTEWMLMEFAEGKRKAFDPADYRQVLWTAREEALAKLRERASLVMISAGMVWTKCSEPVYSLVRPVARDAGLAPLVRPRVAPLYSGEERMLASDIFRADRWDDLVQEAEARWGKAGERTIEVDQGARITVFVPESIRYDDERAALLIAVSDVLENKRRYLATAGLPEIRAWLEASEALEAARREWNDETSEALESAADAWASAMAAADGYFSSRMAQALERWRSRPIGHDFGGSLPSGPSAGA